MRLEYFKRIIEENIADCDKTVSARFKHHRATLNSLIKIGLVDESNIDPTLTHDFEHTLNQFKIALLEKKPDRDVRSQLSRARSLSELYKTESVVEVEGQSFSELILAGIRKKYGENIWMENIPKANREELMKGYVNLIDVGRDIVKEGIDEDPKLWTFKDSDKNRAISRAAITIRDYAFGRTLPATRVPDERIAFIERYLGLPKDSLLSKINRTIDLVRRGKKNEELSVSHTSRRKFAQDELNVNLQKLFNEYSDFKIKGKQPKIINIPPKLEGNRHIDLILSVTEVTKRSNKKWTVNVAGNCGAQVGFKKILKAFQHHCITYENIRFEDISTKHLTTPRILSNFVDEAKARKIGVSLDARLINFVHITSGERGYLRFCGDTGERTIDEFEEDLNFINIKYTDWAQELSDIKKLVSKSDGNLKGKKKVKFLIELPRTERREVIKCLSDTMMNDALTNKKEAQLKLKWASKIHSAKEKLEQLNSVAVSIKDAFVKAQYAVVLDIAFVNIPRAMNWVTLNYYESNIKQNTGYSSLTYHRQKNRFQLFIPCYGSSLIDDSKSVRHLKNSEGQNTVDINILLPESKSSKIKEFLKIRELYIEHLIKHKLSRIEELNSIKLSSPKGIKLLFPWLAYRAEEVKDEARKQLLKNYIQTPSKFGEVFEHMTYKYLLKLFPEYSQVGINIHALRHLVVVDHLDKYPGDYLGAAAKINDTVQQIIETYGDKDVASAMQRVADLES